MQIPRLGWLPIRLAGAAFLAIASGWFAPCMLAAPTATQTLALNPGWNAVHLSVLPADATLDAVFNGIDVDSVWAYDAGLGTPDFVQEVTEQALSKQGWRSWVSSSRPESFQNDLRLVQANRAYLVKLKGTVPVQISISGRPSLRPVAWQPDALNFRGLPVDPALPPTFGTFFQPSAAHYNKTTGLEAMYRLTSAGSWQKVLSTDLIRAGEAYWIYSRGQSTYMSPIAVTLDYGDGLDFGSALAELGLGIKNLGSGQNITIRDLAGGTTPLARAVTGVDGTLGWPAWTFPWVTPLATGTGTSERIALRRESMTAATYETVLEITDAKGSRLLLPVSGAAPPPLPGARVAARRSAGLSVVPGEAATHAGLWVGNAAIQAVSESHSGPLTTNVSLGFTIKLETNIVSQIVTTNRIPNGLNRTNVSLTPTPTGSEFHLRILVHVDASGKSRLLKEVIQMWKPGTRTNDADGVAVVDQPGREVLLTDDSKIGQFAGITTRDGAPVGRRLSTAGFDFADNELPLGGEFAIGGILRGTNSMSDTFATNPFKHKYHPDHGKGYDIQRIIELQFVPPPDNPPPGYGERVMDGIYRETIRGLHRTNILVGGTFRLKRVTTTAELNPQP